MRIQQEHHGDQRSLLRSGSSESESDLEAQPRGRTKEGRDLDRRRSIRKPPLLRRSSISNVSHRVTEQVQPEWALLLIGCILGLTTGLLVVTFNKGEKIIHDWAWAGTPHEGAAWLRLQRLADTWHRIMLVPVTGGVIVGVMHAVIAIIDQIKTSRSNEIRRFDLLAGMCPVLKAIQAAVTLGTGCSLGPEGPSVDIGKSCALGYAAMSNSNRQRKIALVAAGAAAGISSGFNAAVAGCFFAIETVLRPLHAENSPPLTTAMIILASVLSATVSNSILGERPAFTVPAYELKSAAELPLYLVLGLVCGVIGVVFTRLVEWFTSLFNVMKERLGIPMTVTPALGGLGVGIIALRYPGVLYWGFTNVEEILQTGKTVSAPGKWLLTQLIAAKVVATALCKGSGLVGGLYAPSLMMGSAVGALFGDLAGRAIPGHAAVAHPQAYALVGMACFLASVCSVPLTSVLLLFELTKDYHILLPLMGAVGLAIWVPALENQRSGQHGISSHMHSYLPVSDDIQIGNEHRVWVIKNDQMEVELCTINGEIGPEMVDEELLLDELKVGQAMTKSFAKVQATATIKEAVQTMIDARLSCVLVVDENDLLEGIFTDSDLHREVIGAAISTSHGDTTTLDVTSILVAAICTGNFSNQDAEGNDESRDIVVCYPDMSLRVAQHILYSRHIKQLPVVSRGGRRWQDRGRKLCGVLTKEDISVFLRKEATKRVLALVKKEEEEPCFTH